MKKLYEEKSGGVLRENERESEECSPLISQRESMTNGSMSRLLASFRLNMMAQKQGHFHDLLATILYSQMPCVLSFATCHTALLPYVTECSNDQEIGNLEMPAIESAPRLAIR